MFDMILVKHILSQIREALEKIVQYPAQMILPKHRKEWKNWTASAFFSWPLGNRYKPSQKSLLSRTLR
jgi:hypothetical protein